MKTHLFLLPLLAVTPVAASARPKPKTSTAQILVDPAAKALLDRATATYKNARGLRFSSILTHGKEIGDQSSVAFQRPGLLRLTSRTERGTQRIQSDGNGAYFVTGRRYFTTASLDESCTMTFGQTGTAGGMIAEMMGGHTPIVYLSHTEAGLPFDKLTLRARALPARLVDGEMMRGVRVNRFSVSRKANKTASPERMNMTLWFSIPHALLRRVQWECPSEPLCKVGQQKLSHQEINPLLAPGAFRFNPAGLKLLTSKDLRKQQRERILFERRLMRMEN